MGELLALGSALAFGLTHVASGLISRRIHGMTTALYAQIGGTLLSLAIVAAFPGGSPTPGALLWGAVSGVGAGTGMAFLYRGMSRGAMSVVVPISDVVAMAVPVGVALVLLGEHPSSLAMSGIALAVPAVWAISRPGGQRGEQRDRSRAGAGDALLSGAGIALHFIALAQVPAEAGFWPIVVSRAVSVVAIVPMIAATRAPLRAPRRLAGLAAAAGGLGTLATVLYMLAVQQQLMTVAVVLSALYPAIPVLVGILALSERPGRAQVAGLVGAGMAIGLLAAG